MLQRFLGYLSNSRSSRQIHSLDGLRAMAIILVMFRHGFKQVDFSSLQQSGGSLLVNGYAVLFNSGWMGVDLFFVLSGFLIGGQLLRFYESSGPSRSIWRFYANRFFRIIPPYFGLLLLIQFVAVKMPLFAGSLNPDYVSKYIGYHYLFLQDYIGSFMFPVFWSLGVEEKFYVLAPLLIWALCYLTKGRRTRLAALVALLAVPLVGRALLTHSSPDLAAFHYGTLRYGWFHLRMDGLIVGVMVAFLHSHHRDHPWLASETTRRILLPLGLLTTLAVLVYTPSAPPWGSWSLVYSGTAIALSFGLLVLGATLTPNERAGILGSSFLFFIARISYSLYLTHDLWVAPVMQAFIRYLAPLQWPIAVQLSVYFAGFSLAATGAATVYYYVLEKPAILLKERFSMAHIQAVRANAETNADES